MNFKMNEQTDFDREYLLQTRKEIDTEKRERDHILYLAVVVLGAIGFAMAQTDKAQDFLRQPSSLAFEISTLVILTSLFWVRWMKLRQIADRWYTLNRLINRHYNSQQAAEYMEAVVIKGFKKAHYIKKDIVLNFALSLPIYSLILLSSLNLSISSAWQIIIPMLIIGIHILISIGVLNRKLRDPFNQEYINKNTKESEEKNA